jgi:hypothetical protein
MIKQLDIDEIYIETQERFVDRVLAWEENFYGNQRNQSNGPQGKNAAGPNAQLQPTLDTAGVGGNGSESNNAGPVQPAGL